jgi:ribonucleotide monophosphatase NagD (HAD superfamily)
MSNFKSISGLAQIAGNYDVILCDIWGVIHNGNSPYKPATEALELFRSENGPVILISNSPKPSISIPRAFDSIGVLGDFYDAVVTSGDAIINEIARRAPGPVFKLGPDRDDVLYADMDLHFYILYWYV